MTSIDRNYDKTELEYRANKYTLKCVRVMVVCMGLIWLTNALRIFAVDQRMMTFATLQSVLPMIVTIILAKWIDLRQWWVKYFLIFIVALATTIVGSILTYHTVLVCVIPLLVATQYIDKRVLIYAYVLTVISVFITVMGGYYYGMCDFNMLLLTTEPPAEYAKLLTEMGYEGLWNKNPWIYLPLFFVLPRCVFFCVLLPLIQSISENIMRYAEYAADTKKHSEMDEMTGLFNRNKFLDMLENYYPRVEQVGVLFLDVNDLKHVNDTMGHDKGDYLIKTVAACVVRLSDERCKGYRIGGDEFVLIIENPAEGEMERMLYKWDKLIEVSNQISDIPCSAAVGIAGGSGRSIQVLVKDADKRMYIKKEAQKQDVRKP